jgi:hypothetical protein
MRSKTLEALPDGAYVRVRLSGSGDDLETVRLLRVADPTEDEIRFGHVSKRVHIRRFLVAGWFDTWVLPADVIEAPAEPVPSTLRVIAYIESEVGPKPPDRRFARA